MFRITLFIAAFIAGVVSEYWRIRQTANSDQRDLVSHQSRWRAEAHKLVTSYLLLRVGLLGGSELMQTGSTGVLVSSLLAVSLAVGICLLALALLATTKLDRDIRISLAVHFGSVSIGTFAAATAFLKAMNMSYSPITSTWVALMEFPALLLGVGLLDAGARSLLRLFGQDKSMFLLPIAFIVGLGVGPRIGHSPAFVFLFETAFDPMLLYFLYEMGRQARVYARSLGTNSRVLICMGMTMPLLGGTLGTAAGRLAGLETGDTMLLGSLAASASYVAAPTTMRTALVALGSNPARATQAASTGLTVALGITLPFNLLFGLRFYLLEAQWFASPLRAGIGLAAVLICFGGLLLRNRLLGWVAMQRGLGCANACQLHSQSDPISVA